MWKFDNLVGAMYLQAYWMLTSGDELGRCEYCSRIISLARPHPEGRKRRRDKRFCDDACRQANHRRKKSGIDPLSRSDQSCVTRFRERSRADGEV